MSSHPLYRPIDREPKLADRATQQLQGLITGQDFKPGDRLPSERELSELLGVSRTVVREALRALSAKGLVEVRGGAGAFVRAPSMGMVSEMLSICLAHTDTGDVSHAHVLQLRRALETEMASLAAEHRDDADLAELQRLVDDLGREGLSAEEYARVDTGFHDALARAGKNPLFPLILRSLADIMVRVRLVASSLPGSSATSFGHHRRILEEVRKGSAAGARRAMEDHLLEAETTARRALARIASPAAGLDGSSRNGGLAIQD